MAALIALLVWQLKSITVSNDSLRPGIFLTITNVKTYKRDWIRIPKANHLRTTGSNGVNLTSLSTAYYEEKPAGYIFTAL